MDVDIRRFSSSDRSTRFVALQPLPAGEPTSLSAGPVVLGVGAMYAHCESDRTHTLALVLSTYSRSGEPVLETGNDLLLSIDGTWLASRAEPGGLVYQVEKTGRGLRETVMVPMSPDQIRTLAAASEVRGRLGPWFSFRLPKAQRRALVRLLEEVPDDVVFNRIPAVATVRISTD